MGERMAACLYCQQEAGVTEYHLACVAQLGTRKAVVTAPTASITEYSPQVSISLACPKCRSESVRSVQVAYLGGVSRVTGSATGIGVSLGGIGIGGGSI